MKNFKIQKKRKTEIDGLYDNLAFIYFEENAFNKKLEAITGLPSGNRLRSKQHERRASLTRTQPVSIKPSRKLKRKASHSNTSTSKARNINVSDTEKQDRKRDYKELDDGKIHFAKPQNQVNFGADSDDSQSENDRQLESERQSITSDNSVETEPYNQDDTLDVDVTTSTDELNLGDESNLDPIVIGEKIGVGSLVIVRLQMFGWWFGKISRIKTFRRSKPYVVDVKWFGDHTVMEVPVYCIENYEAFPEVFSKKKMSKKNYKKAVEEFLMELFLAFGGIEEDLQTFSFNMGKSVSNVLLQWGLSGFEAIVDSFDKSKVHSKSGTKRNRKASEIMSTSKAENSFTSSDSDTSDSSSSRDEILTSTPCKILDMRKVTTNKSSMTSSCQSTYEAKKHFKKCTISETSFEKHSKQEDIEDDVRCIKKALEKKQGLQSNKRNESPDMSIDGNTDELTFKIGELVIGKLRGFDWWFGKIISHRKAKKPQPPVGSYWVKWYGDQKISMLPQERLENLSTFPTRVLMKKLKGVYLKAVREILEDAAKCCNKEFVADEEKRLRLMIDWAMNSFRPEGVQHFCVKEETIIEEETESESEEDEEIEKRFAPDLSMEIKALFDEVLQGKRKIEDLCLGCGDEKVNCKHPLFHGGLCKECKEAFMESVYLFDEEGFQMYCCICGDGQHIISCNTPTCKRSYCSVCLEMFCGNGYMNKLASMESWECFLCSQLAVKLVKCRQNWQEHINQLFKEDLESVDYGEVIFYNPIPVDERKPLRVLALFDGIATGLYVLKELNFKIELYLAAEIDEHAITVSKVRHGSSIRHIGNVRNLQRKDIEEFGPFDLVMGGSPCNDLSIANPQRRGIYDGSGVLFFEFFRLLNYAMPHPPESRPFFWLFENVVGMRYSDRETISRFLSCHPVVISAKDVSAQYRTRYFWGNLPGMGRSLTPSSNDKLLLQDCLERGCDRRAKFEKVRCITTRTNSTRQTRHLVLPVTMESKDDGLWITEIERLFGFPEHYTDVANMGRTHRQKLLGKAWSVPVIRHLLLPLKDYFQVVHPENDEVTE